MEKLIRNLPCVLVERTGVSNKSGKPYRMLILRVTTELGDCDVVLNIYGDRAGLMLDIISRKEENDGVSIDRIH